MGPQKQLFVGDRECQRCVGGFACRCVFTPPEWKNDVIPAAQEPQPAPTSNDPPEPQHKTPPRNDIQKEEPVDKVRLVEEDAKDNLFPPKLLISRRRGKVKEFKTELFDFEIYAKSTKTVGFLTARPLQWAIALEKYIEATSSNRCRWRYKVENGKYTEGHLTLYYNDTNKVEIVVHFLGGAVVVIGENFRDWVVNEFPKVKALLASAPNTHPGGLPSDEKPQTDDINDTLDSLWAKLEEIEGAVYNGDDVVQKVIDRCQTMEITLNGHGDKLTSSVTDAMLLIVEKRMDQKLTVFMETTTNDVTKKVEAMKKSLTAEINTIKKDVGEIQSWVKLVKQEAEIEDSRTRFGKNLIMLTWSLESTSKISRRPCI